MGNALVTKPNPDPIRNTIMKYRGGPNQQIVDFILERD